MSLVTRILGFVLCVAGAFVAGFAQALHSTAGIADGWIIKYASVLGVAPNGSYLARVLAETDGYVQQNVTTVWTYYLTVGIALAIVGAALVAAGDRKAKIPEPQGARLSGPSR